MFALSEDLKQYIVVSDLTVATQELCHATTIFVFIEATYPLCEYFCSAAVNKQPG